MLYLLTLVDCQPKKWWSTSSKWLQ